MSCLNQSETNPECNNNNITESRNLDDFLVTMLKNASQTIIQPPIVSDIVLWWLRMVVLGIICQSLALFGVITNAINIFVFIKMGVKDPMNVSLLSLSLSDFFSCVTVIWFNICLFPPFMELDLPFSPEAMQYLSGAWAHVICVKTTTLITAFITIERCLCVTYPLKVKDIITTKRVTITIVSFFVLNLFLAAPIYYVNRYEWVFYPEINKTIYTLVFTEERDDVEPTIFFIMGVFFPFLSFFAIIISAIILIYNLKKNARWRQEATGNSTKAASSSSSSEPSSSSGNQQMSSRDAKVAKMVVMISTLFLVCFSPVVMSTVAMIAEPEISEGGALVNLLHTLFYINFLLETTNASLNIFIYLHTSSNYKAMFSAIFAFKSKSKKVSD